jgi:hypothetical protein
MVYIRLADGAFAGENGSFAPAIKEFSGEIKMFFWKNELSV